MGFEPTRAEHTGLAVQRLNHSASSSRHFLLKKSFLAVNLPQINTLVSIEHYRSELSKFDEHLICRLPEAGWFYSHEIFKEQ